jgi:hypothetical protein
MQIGVRYTKLLRHVAWLLLASSACLTSCSGTHEPGQVAPTPPRMGTPAPTTNVPALLGVSIDGLYERLGPAQPLPPDLADPAEIFGRDTNLTKQDSVASFRTGGLTLLASYDAHTRRVDDLLLLGRREDSLMARSTLRANARDYLVLPVFRVNEPGHLLGLRIVSLN